MANRAELELLRTQLQQGGHRLRSSVGTPDFPLAQAALGSKLEKAQMALAAPRNPNVPEAVYQQLDDTYRRQLYSYNAERERVRYVTTPPIVLTELPPRRRASPTGIAPLNVDEAEDSVLPDVGITLSEILTSPLSTLQRLRNWMAPQNVPIYKRPGTWISIALVGGVVYWYYKKEGKI